MTALVPPQLIDIGSNLSDPIFRGNYHGKQVHQDDFEQIIGRARQAGVVAQVLTGDCLKGAREVIALSKQYPGLFATVGCHPCRADEFDAYSEGPEAYLDALAKEVEANIGVVVAIGECGLDYDRLGLCGKEAQLKWFAPQLHLASRYDLPLFLHSRAAHADFIAALKAHPHPLRGVVHSHSGSLEEALECIEQGFYIGINGCSLKTPENIACVKALPLSKLMVESDCPWCEIRPSHASFPLLSSLCTSPYASLKDVYIPTGTKKEKWTLGKPVKGRNEPLATAQVAWVVAQLKGISLEEVAAQTYKNSVELFGLALEEEEIDCVEEEEVPSS